MADETASPVTKHFNQLTEAEQERLVILIEEAVEVAQAGTKILRHGYESVYNGETNRQALQRELGHVVNAVDFMVFKGDLSGGDVMDSSEDKANKITGYLHHQ